MNERQINTLRRGLTLSGLIISHHASERMRERDITVRECLHIIRTGKIKTIEYVEDYENFECRIFGTHDGRNLAVVIAVPKSSPPIIVVTVID